MVAEANALSRTSDRKVVVLRGRFQPFTRIHYECVKRFYLSHYEQDHYLLIIGVVRDVEVLATELATDCKFTVRREGNDYRHLPLFNPMHFAECAERINHDIQTFAREDLHLDRKDQFLNFCRDQLIVNLLPLKVEELLEGMFGSEGSFDDYLLRIVKAFPETPPKNEDEMSLSNPGHGLATALVQLALEQLRATYTSAPGRLAWLWPVMDREDLSIYDQTLKRYYPDQVLPCFVPSEEYEELVFKPKYDVFQNAGRLSVYGTFMYWALLKLTYQYRPDANIPKEIDRIRKWCLRLRFVTQETLTIFEKMMGERAKKIFDDRDKGLNGRYQKVYGPKGFEDAASRYLKPLEPDELNRLASAAKAINIGTMEVGRFQMEDVLFVLSQAQAFQNAGTKEHQKRFELIQKLAEKLKKNEGEYSLSKDRSQVVRMIFGNLDRKSWYPDFDQISIEKLEDCLLGFENVYEHHT